MTPARLVGAQCVMPGCIRPPHGAGLCWTHYTAALPFDPADPISVELAVERLRGDGVEDSLGFTAHDRLMLDIYDIAYESLGEPELLHDDPEADVA